jgi:hypothetical protein
MSKSGYDPVMKVTLPVRDRVNALARQLSAERDRRVTASEAIEELFRHWDATSELAREVRRS